MLEVKTILCGALEVNCYVVHERGSSTCAAIDPSDDGPVRAYIAEKRLTLTHVLLTHGHFDHIGGVAALQKDGAKVYIHEADADMLRSERRSLAVFAGAHVDTCEPDVLLSDGDRVTAGGMEFLALHTPGHSRGSVCYLQEQARAIFTGDTLFHMSVGRVDFPGSSWDALYQSVMERLYTLEGDYTVYPGHMRSSTLEHERKYNPYTRPGRVGQW